MCGLCGSFEDGRRWLDAATTLDPSAVRRERMRRLSVIRRVLKPARVGVDDFEGARFVLRGPTGASEIVDNLFDLWRSAEALGRRKIDPLAHVPSGVSARPTISMPSPRQVAAAERTSARHPPAPQPLRAQRPNPGLADGDGRTRLHVLTGFLGSGKTTLLNRLLGDPAFADSAVLINEIGAVSIDHHLVERVERGRDLDLIVLKGGCTCCALRGDLATALRGLHRRREQGTLGFRRVVLETTGLADPAPILFTLAADPMLRPRFVPGRVITTVDAMHGKAQIGRHPECRKQIAVADHLVVTKADLVDPTATRALSRRLAGLNPAADIVLARQPAALQGLLDEARIPLVPRQTFYADTAEHSPHVDSVAVTLTQPLAWSTFAVWLTLLLHAHGENILRFKALLDVAGWPAPVSLDAVHHLIHPPAHLPDWPAGPRTSRLVFITQRLQADRIEPCLRAFAVDETFAAAIAPPPSPHGRAIAT